MALANAGRDSLLARDAFRSGRPREARDLFTLEAVNKLEAGEPLGACLAGIDALTSAEDCLEASLRNKDFKGARGDALSWLCISSALRSMTGPGSSTNNNRKQREERDLLKVLAREGKSRGIVSV
jgi:hypothetical protein